jgi:AbrB family looped-hinge helix DNA binding protein
MSNTYGGDVRVTSKGQVTIPIDIRDRLGIQPNTEVRFVVRKGIVVLEKAPGRGAMKRPNRGEAIVARLRRTARGATRSTMTTDELMALTRAE